MRNGVFVIAATVLGLAAVVAAQTATPPAAGEDNAALKQKIKELEARLDKVEASKDENRQVEREEIIKIIKEMKLDVDKHTDLRLFWKDGIRMESADGAFKLHLGGRLQTDWTWFKDHGFPTHKPLGNSDVKDGAELRRVILGIDGQIYDNVEFCVQYNFAGQTMVENGSGVATQIGTPKPVDVYLRLTKIPVVGDITAGRFTEPFSMEALASDADETFIEPSLGNALAPGRNMGFQLHNAFLQDDAKVNRMTYAVGMFRQTDDFSFEQTDGGYDFTGRVTGLPWYADGGKQLIHLGGAYSYRCPQGMAQFQAKPEDNMAPYLVDTGMFGSDTLHLFGAEAAGVYGPAHVEGEYMAAVSNSAGAAKNGSNDETFQACYVQGGYFITGESRPYNTSGGTWDRVRPKKNFREGGGWGAWEVAARYSWIDLNSGRVYGGEMNDVTIGLNWYLNPNVKIMWDYVHSTQDTWGTSSDALMMRFQVDF